MVQEGLSQRFSQLTGAKRLQELLDDLGDLFVAVHVDTSRKEKAPAQAGAC